MTSSQTADSVCTAVATSTPVDVSVTLPAPTSRRRQNEITVETASTTARPIAASERNRQPCVSGTRTWPLGTKTR